VPAAFDGRSPGLYQVSVANGLFAGSETLERVEFVAPATFPAVALLAPTADIGAASSDTEGVRIRGTFGIAYTPGGCQLPTAWLCWAKAKFPAARSEQSRANLRINASSMSYLTCNTSLHHNAMIKVDKTGCLVTLDHFDRSIGAATDTKSATTDATSY
jgi:hypothetical protein